ncbi:MAG TPA: response regulator [Chthonomonadales bacterium]|nr:response regulator [Chthonomonadales bacterium]
MAHILVIDDEHNIRMMIRLALQHAGHQVETAADGYEGVDKFRDGRPWDLVLLDQRMPGLEGLAVLRQIRYHNPAARIVMVTAIGTVELAVDAIKAGATNLLRKPFTADTLRRVVQAALEENNAAVPVASADSVTFGMATINGYRIEYKPEAGVRRNGETAYRFRVTRPGGDTEECEVILPDGTAELIKAKSGRDTLPFGDRFWQALCEEALANYLYQQAETPPDSVLRVDDLTSGMERWVSAVLSETSPSQDESAENGSE